MSLRFEAGTVIEIPDGGKYTFYPPQPKKQRLADLHEVEVDKLLDGRITPGTRPPPGGDIRE